MTKKSSEKDEAASRQMTVLVAEDNVSTRRVLCEHLEAMGYSVIASVSDGKEAVRLTLELAPSLLVMDIKMPNMSGLEAARIISRSRPLPIVIVTGYSSEELAAEAFDAGVFAYIVKPVSIKHLRPAITLALARYGEFVKLKDEVDDLKEAIESRKLIERAKGILMKRCNIGEEEAFKLLQAHSQKENKKMRELAATIVEASKLI